MQCSGDCLAYVYFFSLILNGKIITAPQNSGLFKAVAYLRNLVSYCPLISEITFDTPGFVVNCFVLKPAISPGTLTRMSEIWFAILNLSYT